MSDLVSLACRNRSGVVAELVVASRLLAAGHHVAVPLVDDDGVDLVVNYRFRVQIKSSGLWEVKTGYPFYSFKSPVGWSRADVYVLHGQAAGKSQERWWVIPSHALETVNGSALSLRPWGSGRRGSRSEEFSVWLDRWDLFAS